MDQCFVAGAVASFIHGDTSGAAPFANIPGIVSPLFVALALTIVLGTCWVCHDRSVDDSWPALAASALLASPLGWLYYAWWMLPGVKPSRLLVRSPLLWIPMTFLTRGQPSPWATITYASVFNWDCCSRGWVSSCCRAGRNRSVLRRNWLFTMRQVLRRDAEQRQEPDQREAPEIARVVGGGRGSNDPGSFT